MKRLSVFQAIVPMLVALTFCNASSSFAVEVDADLAKLSESPGSAAANLALIGERESASVFGGETIVGKRRL